MREPDLYIDKERIYRFYAGRIHRAASASDLRKIILKKGSDKFLYISENQCCPRELPEAVKNFPEAITMGSRQYALDYTFAPGDEHDGITVAVPVSDVQFLHEHTLDWLAPQLWEEKVEWLLRSLPKKERKQFIPIKTKAAEIAAAMKYMPVSFTQALCDTAKKLYGISITPDLFDRESLPSHLRMRVSVRGRKGRVLVESDDIDSLRKTFAGISPRKRKNPLAAIFRNYERHNIASWDIGDIPEHIEVQKPAQGNPVYGFPALTPGKEGVDLRLFTDADEAEYSHERGVCKLLEMKLAKELAWIEKDLKFDKQLSLSFKPFGGTETLKKRLVALLRDHFLTLYDKPPRAGEDFESLVNMKKKEAGRAGGSAVLPVEQAMKEFSTNQRLIDKLSAKFKSAMYERLAKELKERNSRYISSLFTGGLLYQQFLQLPRVVQAFRYCIEKAFTDTKKYTARIEEADRLSVQIETLKKSLAGCKPQARNAMVDCIMFMEEYIISLFAQQQVKTRFPVSKKRLEKKWEMVREYM